MEAAEKIIFVFAAVFLVMFFFKKMPHPKVASGSDASNPGYGNLPPYIYENMPYSLPATGPIPNYAAGQANMSGNSPSLGLWSEDNFGLYL